MDTPLLSDSDQDTCNRPPPRRAASSSPCVRPAGHTDHFCQFEQWQRMVGTIVVLDENPGWDGVDRFAVELQERMDNGYDPYASIDTAAAQPSNQTP